MDFLVTKQNPNEVKFGAKVIQGNTNGINKLYLCVKLQFSSSNRSHTKIAKSTKFSKHVSSLEKALTFFIQLFIDMNSFEGFVFIFDIL